MGGVDRFIHRSLSGAIVLIPSLEESDPSIPAVMAVLGLDPRIDPAAGQNSSGGKERLGAITKQGNRCIRRLLVLGATVLLGALRKRKGPLRDWYAALLARRPARLASVAMANKLARIAWAMMATGEAFRTEAFERA
jgi:transposase